MVRSVLLAVALLGLDLVTCAQAQTRVDLFDAKSNRQGYIVVDPKTGRVDRYDVNSQRQGYGQVDQSTGKVDFYDLRGNRTGSGTITPTLREERKQ